jgi:uncharacterized protein (DUF433 family)
MGRRRWQVDLRTEDELTLARARQVFGAEGDSEAGRALLGLFAKLSAAIEQGTVISFLPGDDPRAVDAFPEFTRILRPENRYTWLVAAPHPWRKQLSIKGRRLTAGQLVEAMEAGDLNVEAAARGFELPVDAVIEAVDYVARNRPLVLAEAAEERRRAEPSLAHRAAAEAEAREHDDLAFVAAVREHQLSALAKHADSY